MRLPRLHALLLGAVSCCSQLVAAEPALSYNRDVRPILSDNCFHCHGPDKGHRKGKLRLDVREEALAKEAFVPGKPDESELVKRIFTTKDEDLMPPAEAHKTLTSAQKELLKRWVAEGAKYEPHWAYINPSRPEVPGAQNSAAKNSNPIDAFILATLAEKKIQPSPEADRRTLLRRLSLDLTGLPPTAEEMAAFLRDKSARAYEKQVDRLLASPRFGERMAVPWLDVVRFTDTVGYHGDQNANVFPYRDYVINAFNRNKPFDQFTIEQLAGDLLPNSTAEQRIATGFNRLNMVTREGGAQPKEYLAKYGADRVRTVGMAWMGISVGCAECHDHKFDPFTMKDFYSMKAFFADIKEWGVYSDYKYTPNPDLKNWSNDHPFPPEEIVESDYLKRRIGLLRGQMTDLAESTWKSAPEAVRGGFSAWKKEAASALKKSAGGWRPAWPVPGVFTNVTVVTNRLKWTNIVLTAGGASLTNVTNRLSFKTNQTVFTNFVVDSGTVLLFPAKVVENTPLTLQPEPGWMAALRLEALPHERHGNSVFLTGNKSASVQLSAVLKRPGQKDRKLAFYHAEADRKEPRYENGFEVLGIRDSWRLDRERGGEKQTAIWWLDPPVRLEPGDSLVLQLKSMQLGAFRVSASPVAPDLSRGQSAIFARLDSSVLASANAKVNWLASTAPDTNAFADYKKLHRSLVECRDGKSPTLITVAWNPAVTRVLPRGNWQSDDGELVQPGAPHFLPQPASLGTNRQTRLDLARWLVSRDNPLTARVVVNRLWKQFFGNGLATPVDDFGSQGEPPSHPELLDWLATEFRDGPALGTAARKSGVGAWDVKHLVRLMVTSATYRQRSSARPELRDVDPNNRLLAFQNPRRLEAEFVRDNALFVAGLLNLELGGPSAHPYQPAGYYSNLQFPDRDYLASKDDRQYRRGLYSHWQRTFLHPMLANFDAPAREECTANRTVSNTPQQALTLLNDPTFVEAARVWATRLLRSMAKNDEARLDLAFQQALGRGLKPKELASLKSFLAQQRQHLAEDKEEAGKLLKVGLAKASAGLEDGELAAWTSVCRVMLNLQETITRY